MNPIYDRDRKPDYQYENNLLKIRREGIYTKNPFQTRGTLTCLNVNEMEFYFSNGFPIQTTRKIGFWRRPIGELLAFINGVRDARILAEDPWKCMWWADKWATPEKCGVFGLKPYDLGDGSYPAAFHDFPNMEWQGVENHPDGGRFVSKPFNQFENLIKQIKKYPDLRTHRITSWIPQYCLQHEDLQRKVVVAPCHGDIQITIINGKLYFRMDQRSCDFILGGPSNIIQWAAMAVMMSHVLGYEPYKYTHAVHDAQIYENHINEANTLISRNSFPFPCLYLTDEGLKIDNIFDFRPSHFQIEEYKYHPAIDGMDPTI